LLQLLAGAQEELKLLVQMVDLAAAALETIVLEELQLKQILAVVPVQVLPVEVVLHIHHHFGVVAAVVALVEQAQQDQFHLRLAEAMVELVLMRLQ
jgi:hypothetical protein